MSEAKINMSLDQIIQKNKGSNSRGRGGQRGSRGNRGASRETENLGRAFEICSDGACAHSVSGGHQEQGD